jgi:hypothetical protein
VNEIGMVTVTKKSFLTDAEFTRITEKLKRFGVGYDRSAHLWFGGRISKRITA